MITNDNNSGTNGGHPREADAHGQAALLLVESLIHALCERSVLSAEQAADIALSAVDVQLERAQVADGSAGAMWDSHALLLHITSSLMVDTSDLPLPRLPT